MEGCASKHSEQVVCEELGGAGSSLCCGAPHPLVQSALSTLFRFSWLCLAFRSPLGSLILLLFLCAGDAEVLFFYFSSIFLHAISSRCTCTEVQRVRFPALDQICGAYVTFLWPPKGEFTHKTHQIRGHEGDKKTDAKKEKEARN